MPNQQFVDLARSAAKSAAPSSSVGDFLEVIEEGDETFTYLFASKQKGYVGWRWSVTIYQGQTEPTVSEVLLMPGPDALVAPNWVPWSERLADWKALQAELERQAAEEAEDAEDADDAEEDDLDEDDVDEDTLDQPDVDEDAADAELPAGQDEAKGEGINPDTDSEPDLAVSDLKPSEDSESNTRKTRKRIPSFIRRKLRGGKSENSD